VSGSISLRAYTNKLFSGILYDKLLRRFQEWTEASIFLALWKQGLFEYEDCRVEIACIRSRNGRQRFG
jgi:hypothetical protein